jgi:osmotically-inducible protein OsmY
MKSLKRLIANVSVLALAAAFCLPVNADATITAVKGPVKGDAEIQQCISERLAASPSLKAQGITAAVSNGAATLTGTAKNPGSKGAATNVAKRCGATRVVNNITISPDYKPAKKM